jgi:hypothetical protein
MKKYLLILCLLLQINLISHEIEKKYFFSICAIFKNEAPYLKEWIEYHRLHGCEHFYLCNNESTDDYRLVLEDYIKNNIVELFESPNLENESNHRKAQKRAYNFCLNYSKNDTEWLAFIDIDEFILPLNQRYLVDFLRTIHANKKIGLITVNWQLFGTSNIYELSKDKLLIEQLIHKAHPQFSGRSTPDNRVFKSILRPIAIKTMGPHFGELDQEYESYPRNNIMLNKKNILETCVTKKIADQQIVINHYFTRDEKFFKEKNVRKTKNRNFSPNYLLNLKLYLNACEDRTIFQHVPELKQRMGKT